ncbi:MAG TPA: hydrogenase expression/formation protein HypE [Vicinamibacterales bacterium]|nr:hydrogenase expression/formation protein HypE [Vicinamibacterales bacterium]
MSDPPQGFNCPVPLADRTTVLLGHGSGGKLSAELVRDLFLPAFRHPALARLDDQAIVRVNGSRLAFTTDSFVVKPLFFPGGDIGTLAVHGTINDLAMGGAQPLFLSVAFIIEEGLPMDDLRRVVASIQRSAERAGVAIVTGDTKVVERGSGDGLFVTTSGIGFVPDGVDLSADRVRPGDAVLLSGSIGDHGITILGQREGLRFDSPVESDSAALHTLVADMLAVGDGFRCFRDPTRGGLASALNEIAAQSGVAIELDETRLPIRDEVRGACELLGLDPLYVANEGKLVALVDPALADRALEAMHAHPLGAQATRIGTVHATTRGPIVTMRTPFGTTRIVDMLAGDQLPRIC